MDQNRKKLILKFLENTDQKWPNSVFDYCTHFKALNKYD